MRRATATALVVSSVLALAVTSGSKLPFGLAFLIIVVGCLGERWELPARGLAAAVLIAGLGSFLFPPPLPRVHGFLFEPGLSFSLGFYACLGSGLLLLRRNKGWEDLLLLVTTTLTVLVAGNTNQALPFGYTVIGYVLFTVLYLRARRFGVRVSTVGTSFLAIALTLVLSFTFSSNEANFAQMINSLQFWSSTVNFGDVAGIQPQSGPGGSKILLRVVSQNPENYFAARRYVTYHNQKWLATANKTLEAQSVGGESAYPLGEPLGTDWNPKQIDRVELTTLSPNALLAPLHTEAIFAELRLAQVGECGDLIVREAGSAFSGSYEVALGDATVAEDPELLQRCLQVEVEPSVSSLAREIAGDNTDKLKVFALIQFFHQNFEYGFGYPFDQAEDPVATFLKERPPAHCEVFATSLALMCRSVGVPARYVQGFLVREKNTWGDYWVARERDAHAWVEVYIEGMGWVTVDSTPPGVSEPVESSSSWSEFTDTVKRYAQRLWLSVARGPTAILKSLMSLVTTHPLAVGLFVALGLLWKYRARFRFSKELDSTPTAGPHPQIAKAQALLQQLEQVLGETLPCGKTLLEWSKEQPDGAEFLAYYSEMRYSSAAPSEQALEHLVSLLEAVKSSREPEAR